MQTISIALDLPLDNNVLALYFNNRQIPSDTFNWGGAKSSAVITQPIAAQPTQEPAKPSGPTLEDLTKAFLAAVSRAKAAGDDKASAAFKALGTPKVKEVPLVAYAEVIAALNDVAKG